MMAAIDWTSSAKRPRGTPDVLDDPIRSDRECGGVGDAVRNAYRALPVELPDDLSALLLRLN